MKESEINKKIELYLEGKLQGEELHHFEDLLKNDKKVSNLFHCHKHAIETEIQKYAKTCLLNARTHSTKNSINKVI